MIHEILTSLEVDVQYELDNLDFQSEEDIDNSYHYMLSIIETNDEIDIKDKELLINALEEHKNYEKSLFEVLNTIETIRANN